MSAPARWAVVIDPLGMANVVSDRLACIVFDRRPGSEAARAGLTGEWRLSGWWSSYAGAAEHMRGYNATHSPARPVEGGE